MLSICVWTSTGVIYCERQLMCLECGILVSPFLTCLQLFGWDWFVVSSSFVFLEEDLKGADEKKPCTTGYFPTLHEVKPGLPAEKQATKIHTCLVFRKLTWIRQSVIHIADIRQDDTNAQTSFCPILKEFLATGFSVHPPIMPIRTHLCKFCYTTSWLHWKGHCHFTDTIYTS